MRVSNFLLRATNGLARHRAARKEGVRERAHRMDARWLHFRPTTPGSGCNRFNFKFKRRLNLNLTDARFHVAAHRSKIQNSVSINSGLYSLAPGRKPQTFKRATIVSRWPILTNSSHTRSRRFLDTRDPV